MYVLCKARVDCQKSLDTQLIWLCQQQFTRTLNMRTDDASHKSGCVSHNCHKTNRASEWASERAHKISRQISPPRFPPPLSPVLVLALLNDKTAGLPRWQFRILGFFTEKKSPRDQSWGHSVKYWSPHYSAWKWFPHAKKPSYPIMRSFLEIMIAWQLDSTQKNPPTPLWWTHSALK